MTFQEKSSALTDSDTNLLTGKEKVTLTYFCIMYRLKWHTQILSVETSANFYPSSIINHILQVFESPLLHLMCILLVIQYSFSESARMFE